jgi:hypothetical protein
MTPRDWFGVVIRSLGLWTILGAIRGFVGLVGQQSGWTNATTDPKYYYLYTISEFGIGAVMLLGADLIVRLAYSGRSQEGPKPDWSSSDST